jgi:hypothetical protein
LHAEIAYANGASNTPQGAADATAETAAPPSAKAPINRDLKFMDFLQQR